MHQEKLTEIWIRGGETLGGHRKKPYKTLPKKKQKKTKNLIKATKGGTNYLKRFLKKTPGTQKYKGM